MKRHIILALAATAALLGTGAAQAARVDFSVGIAVPPVVATFDGGPAFVGYRDAPQAVYGPVFERPIVVAPRPRIWLPPLPPLPRLPPPPWAWHHDGWRDAGYRDGWRDGRDHDGWHDRRDGWHEGWHGGDHRDDRRDAGHDSGRDANQRGTRGPW